MSEIYEDIEIQILHNVHPDLMASYKCYSPFIFQEYKLGNDGMIYKVKK